MRLLPQMFGVKAQVGIAMEDCWQRKPLLNQSSHALPVHPALLAAMEQHPPPAFAYFEPKALETDEIARNGMIVEVALNNTPQPLPDFRQRPMHARAKFVLHLF